MGSMLMVDGSSPSALPARPVRIVAGYLGGDTPHVWTPAEWRRYQGYRRLPIFTRSDPGGHSGQADALGALGQLWDIGAPRGIVVAWDMESAVASAYLLDVHAVMSWAGYRVWVYGQRSTVFGNPALNGYWVADWTNSPHMHSHPNVRATQWQGSPHGGWDLSQVRWWQWMHRLWKGEIPVR